MKQEKKSVIIAKCRHFDFRIIRLDFDLGDEVSKELG
jgi:hypothetical protein